MIRDQADELRLLVRQTALAGPGALAAPLVTVSGAKGGVGTTTIALNLAVALARQGRRAVFVDADLDHGGHAQFSPHAHGGSVVDVLSGRRDVHEVLERGPSGIQVLSGAWASHEAIDFAAAAQDRFIGELAALAPHAEVVIVDAGSGRGQLARRLWRAAGAAVVVTLADDNSVMQCYAAIKVLAGTDAQPAIHTLVNFADAGDAGEDVHVRVAEACRKFLGLRAAAAGGVPACDTPRGEPVLVFPARSEAGRALDRAADTLWAKLQISAAREPARRGATAVAAC
jgi:flagellar biosynthesis protein FlhG